MVKVQLLRPMKNHEGWQKPGVELHMEEEEVKRLLSLDPPGVKVLDLPKLVELQKEDVIVTDNEIDEVPEDEEETEPLIMDEHKPSGGQKLPEFLKENGFPINVLRAIEGHGIDGISELLTYTESELQEVPGIGPATAKKIFEAMKGYK